MDKTVQILLVEDDEIDVAGVRRAFKKQRIANPITHACDGVEALTILRGQHDGKTIRRPYMVLLDLNMPRMSGIEFLEVLRNDPVLHETIVFVLTTSDADRDIVAAYQQHIAGYLVKGRVGEGFVNLVQMLDHYWRYVEFSPGQK